MADYEIDEIRRIRREISARFDHDVDKLIAHYQELEEKYRKSGKYKFVDPPPDTSDIPELDDDFWENAKQIVPENYCQIEHEILEWFKGQGQDYHTHINKVLQAYIEAHR